MIESYEPPECAMEERVSSRIIYIKDVIKELKELLIGIYLGSADKSLEGFRLSKEDTISAKENLGKSLRAVFEDVESNHEVIICYKGRVNPKDSKTIHRIESFGVMEARRVEGESHVLRWVCSKMTTNDETYTKSLHDVINAAITLCSSWEASNSGSFCTFAYEGQRCLVSACSTLRYISGRCEIPQHFVGTHSWVPNNNSNKWMTFWHPNPVYKDVSSENGLILLVGEEKGNIFAADVDKVREKLSLADTFCVKLGMTTKDYSTRAVRGEIKAMKESKSIRRLVVWYSGHGKANTNDDYPILIMKGDAIALTTILETLEDNGFHCVVVGDCCNPLPDDVLDNQQGASHAPMTNYNNLHWRFTGGLIACSVPKGNVAYYSRGTGSYFTNHFCKNFDGYWHEFFDGEYEHHNNEKVKPVRKHGKNSFKCFDN